MNSSVDTTIADVMTLSPQMPQSDRIAVPESFFKYVGPSDTVGNSLYRCLKCAKGESSKPLSCHDRSRQNLKKHIMSRHIGLLAMFERECERFVDRKQSKKRKLDSEDQTDQMSAHRPLRQTKIDAPVMLTQHHLDEFVMDYIVSNVLSLHHVDTPGFIQLIQNLTLGRYSPACRQTVTKKLEDRFNKRKLQLKEALSTVDRVCTTSDCWTSKRRSFLGVTVHWIDPKTLARKGACLAVRQVTGRHTYDVLAKLLEDIHEEYTIQDKTCFTVTDSGSNFLKAFRHFSIEQTETETEASSPVAQKDTDMEFHQVHDLLHASDSCDDDQIHYRLPPHWKCACHILNLVATTDAGKVASGLLKTTSTQTLTKLTGLWNKQNRSTAAAEKIKAAIGSLFVTPGDTRWNSLYDAFSKVSSILACPELDSNFDRLCDDLAIRRLQPLQKLFVAEYVQVMKPVCCGLDILQGEKDIGLGYLLPTLTVMKSQLQSYLEQPRPLQVCGPLIQALQAGIDRRFGEIWQNSDAQLAAVVHPKFKLDWLEDENEKTHLVQMLKRRIQPLESLSLTSDNQPSTSAVSDSVNSNFFASLATRRHDRDGEKDNVSEEVDRYLADSADSLESLDAYPHIKKMYVVLNTGLPASAACERLFSLGGRVFSPLRTSLSSVHFEMMVFLRMAKW